MQADEGWLTWMRLADCVGAGVGVEPEASGTVGAGAGPCSRVGATPPSDPGPSAPSGSGAGVGSGAGRPEVGGPLKPGAGGRSLALRTDKAHM